MARQLLDYARCPAPVCSVGLAVAAGVVSLACGLFAAGCVAGALRVEEGMRQASGWSCWTCYQAAINRLGPSPAQRLSVGVLSGGLALVAAVQAVRFANGARRR